jgi:Apea-like HEPN
MENYLFEEVLPVTLVIPILFLKFELKHLQIADVISVEELSKELQLARGWHGPYSSWENSLVESAATHALFIRNQSLNNENWWADQMKMNPDWYPLEEINTFVAALRIATGYPTGYAQMLTLPVGWASSYVAHLIPIDGPTMESYPPFFKQGYWANEVPTVSVEEADTVRHTFNGLEQVFATNHSQKVRLAMHRLNLSATRATDEDGVIDAMIAMEALLSDGAQEMTHKVAMRLGGLYKVTDHSRAEKAFVEMKRIYKFRCRPAR